ncbi:Aste57867_19263 [Aphanomyces stellatus]|uniref:Aste57867_19263 protein n=1 Tax=Aphanomyces stellatus TaxID=120398 RepID=A0A485LCF1_9STRA|nr:hypothetical protein As57867_019199 [Aphanomyces stellatus]VFT95983.1 Aste57867_19263 [Aphanomyces stellatus]
MDPALVGAWVSTEAFGNTALDWSEDVKAGKAVLHLSFTEDGHVFFDVQSGDGGKTYAHVLPRESTCECNAAEKILTMHADTTGLTWTYQIEDDANVRLRLVGAKRFARCKGVDNIYLRRQINSTS